MNDFLTKIENKELRKAWTDKGVVRHIEERLKHINNNTREDQQKYQQLRNQVKRETKKTKEVLLEQWCGEINESYKVNKIDYAYHKI